MAKPGQESTPVATGCFKCGRPGHWSRDCPMKSSGSTAGRGGESANQDGFAEEGGKGGGVGDGKVWKAQGKRTPKVDEVKQPPRKRPQLTADLLLSENGLGYLLEKMPQMLSSRGREVDDLRRLLEGYMHWHSRLLPYYGFDDFVEKVEKLGASKRVKMCRRELRAKFADGIESDVLKGSQGEKEAEEEKSFDAERDHEELQKDVSETRSSLDHTLTKSVELQ